MHNINILWLFIQPIILGQHRDFKYQNFPQMELENSKKINKRKINAHFRIVK